MTAAARNIPSDDDFTGTSTRRPTRAGVSAPGGSAPARRGDRKLTLVTDADFDFEPVAPKRARSGPAAPKSPKKVEVIGRVDVDPVTVGTAALKPERAPEETQTRADALRLAPPAPVMVARMPFVVLTLGLIVGGIVGLLLLNMQINEDAFKLTELRERQAELQTAEQQLNKELADKGAPGALAAEAARQGMVPAGTPAYITLPDGRILGVPQPAGQPRR
ncbi:hypothetical protein Lfu02_71890 [Longispora fulva]|uniref:Cell division protein FtsL n=1 Tax=Longispora fulva TaxID=619741 RepID=A0A8J7GPT0_9ACTN|nr:hypothetical protein [Longispora fulva]MBG6141187.1 hypothetical protein [Longispora fulva]GIG62817.1 hypothetical protein Lfu02_71890 [Longispora fulva]